MSLLRSFIAIPTSPEVREKIVEIQSGLRASSADVKWDDPSKLHITLKFLGDVEPAALEEIGNQIESAARYLYQFNIQYDTVGAFPNVIHPRVVWIGCAESHDVARAQLIVENVCTSFGFPKEDRAFHPHITLGRVKSARNLARLTEALKSVTMEPIQARCSDIVLYKSDLRPSGSTYTVIKSFPLQQNTE